MDTQSSPKVINLGKMREGSIEHLNKIPADVLKELPDEDKNLSGIMIGKEMARNMGIFLYDSITIISPAGGIATPMGMVPRMKKFIVVGIYESGFYEYDSKLAFLSIKSCQEFLEMGDTVSGSGYRRPGYLQGGCDRPQHSKQAGIPVLRAKLDADE